MESEIFAIFIPIIFILVTGLVIFTYIFFNSKERQLLIEKGYTPEELKTLYQSRRKSGSNLLKVGVISIIFGIGLGFAITMSEWYHLDALVPMSIFVSAGLGIVAAYYVGKREDKTLENEDKQKVV